MRETYILVFWVDKAPFLFELVAHILHESKCEFSRRVFEIVEDREGKFELSFHFEGLAPVMRRVVVCIQFLFALLVVVGMELLGLVVERKSELKSEEREWDLFSLC